MNFTVEAPNRKKTVLVFDVETSGLLPKKDKSSVNPIPIEAYPYILQLSYAKYDIVTNTLLPSYFEPRFFGYHFPCHSPPVVVFPKGYGRWIRVHFGRSFADYITTVLSACGVLQHIATL